MKKLWIFVIVFLVILCAAIWYIYSVLFPSPLSGNGVILENPAAGLSIDEAVLVFNESFVFYLLANIGAYRLHSAPLSKELPLIEIAVEGKTYSASIDGEIILIGLGEILDEDIIIKTTKREAVLMMNDKSYIFNSFNSGKSEIILVASKTELAGKGYLSLYRDLRRKG